MVPNGWIRLPIKDVCESIIDCVNKTAPVVDYQTNFKMIRTTNVRNGRVDTDNVRYVTEETYRQWIRRGAPKKGDIIFTREAPVGEVGVLEDSNGVFLGQRTMMYRADGGKVNNYFLFYSLTSQFCQKQIDDFSNGGTVGHMRVPDCGEIIVNLPPLAEQRGIAKILAVWDKAIATTERLIVNSQQQKKALMQQLLTGKKRFAGFEGEWSDTDLGTILEPTSYPVSKPSEAYTAAGIRSHGKGTFQRQVEDPSTVAMDTLYELQPNELVVNITFAWEGAAAIVKPKDKGCLVSHRFPTYRIIESEAHVDFIRQVIRSERFVYQLGLISPGGAGRNRVMSKKDFLKLKVSLPSVEEQQKIAFALKSADECIETLQNKLAHLKEEKQALMQQLLTGKRRVKVDEKEIA